MTGPAKHPLWEVEILPFCWYVNGQRLENWETITVDIFTLKRELDYIIMVARP
jgi:hypothetical protein